MRTFFQKSLSFFLPNHCFLCEASLAESGVCRTCQAGFSWQKHACPRCAEPMEQSILCGRCVQGFYYFDQVFSPLLYEGSIKKLISALKFYDRLNTVPLFVELLADYCAAHPKFEMPDLILPAALYPKRLQLRGFNQSLEIAKGLAKTWQIPFLRNTLKKVNNTRPQVELALKDRQKNLRGAFVCAENFPGKHLALVDDVVTSGSTASEMARVLKKSGASRVTVIAVARVSV